MPETSITSWAQDKKQASLKLQAFQAAIAEAEAALEELHHEKSTLSADIDSLRGNAHKLQSEQQSVQLVSHHLSKLPFHLCGALVLRTQASSFRSDELLEHADKLWSAQIDFDQCSLLAQNNLSVKTGQQICCPSDAMQQRSVLTAACL